MALVGARLLGAAEIFFSKAFRRGTDARRDLRPIHLLVRRSVAGEGGGVSGQGPQTVVLDHCAVRFYTALPAPTLPRIGALVHSLVWRSVAGGGGGVPGLRPGSTNGGFGPLCRAFLYGVACTHPAPDAYFLFPDGNHKQSSDWLPSAVGAFAALSGWGIFWGILCLCSVNAQRP